MTRRGGGAGSIPARWVRQTKQTAGAARERRSAEALSEEIDL